MTLKTKKLPESRIREIAAPTIERLKDTYPEWDDTATQRFIDILRPYTEGKIRLVCQQIISPTFAKQVVGHRAKFGARSVVSEEAKEAIAAEDAELGATIDTLPAEPTEQTAAEDNPTAT